MSDLLRVIIGVAQSLQRIAMFIGLIDKVKDPSKLTDDSTCPICADLCIEPVQCLGKCKKLFCRRCAGQWVRNGQLRVNCPNKCTPQSWKFALTARVPIEIRCPYSPNCTIEYAEDYAKHIKECQYLPSEELHKVKLRKKFLCRKQHILSFKVGTYDEIRKSTCVQCHQKGESRLKCLKCNQVYCSNCRPLPCSKESCPIGHGYQFVKPSRPSTVCDVCGMAASLIGMGNYTDKYCNLDICQGCYIYIPQTLKDNEDYMKVVSQTSGECDKRHKLTQIAPLKKLCTLCDKQRYCWRMCQPCNFFYCTSCYDLPINQLMECDKQHLLQPPTSEQLTECMVCLNQQSCATDPECKFIICANCAQRLERIDAEKRRLLKCWTCDQNHILKYYITSAKRLCYSCKTPKVIQMYCGECNPGKLYCLGCQKADLKQLCYFGDVLKKCKQEEAEGKQCLICQDPSKVELWHCKRCSLSVCQDCKKR